MEFVPEQMAMTFGDCVAEDAKSSESMLLAPGGWVGSFGKSRDGLSWRSFGEQIPGVWKQFLMYVANAKHGSGDPGRQELHEIIKQNNNPVRKESLTD